mgnify:CR=1 FL=1
MPARIIAAARQADNSSTTNCQPLLKTHTEGAERAVDSLVAGLVRATQRSKRLVKIVDEISNPTIFHPYEHIVGHQMLTK